VRHAAGGAQPALHSTHRAATGRACPVTDLRDLPPGPAEARLHPAAARQYSHLDPERWYPVVLVTPDPGGTHYWLDTGDEAPERIAAQYLEGRGQRAADCV